MIDYREKILALAQNKPVQPNEVAKAVNTNMIMASAMLAELSATKKLKVSHVKIGTSPLYFLPEKEDQLQNYVFALKEKDRQTAEALQRNKVIWDKTQDPLTRVSLREIKDFSRPVLVQVGDVQELFWKWYLVSDDEAEPLIRQQVEPEGTEKNNSIVNNKDNNKEVAVSDVQIASPATMVNGYKRKSVKNEEKNGGLKERITIFFAGHNIKIIENVSSKGASWNQVIELPTPVGVLVYFCVCLNKQRISDSDISHAFVQGKIKKLPTIIVSSGDISKKGQELLSQLKEVVFQKV